MPCRPIIYPSFLLLFISEPQSFESKVQGLCLKSTKQESVWRLALFLMSHSLVIHKEGLYFKPIYTSFLFIYFFHFIHHRLHFTLSFKPSSKTRGLLLLSRRLWFPRMPFNCLLLCSGGNNPPDLLQPSWHFLQHPY